MKAIVLGAGVVGVTTAYTLLKKGYSVIIIDKASSSGTGSSYANGGQLSYNYHTPIANPNVLFQLPKILLGLDPAFKIYPSTDIDFYCWGIRYLRSCTYNASAHSAGVMQALGTYAKEKISQIVLDTNIKFDYRKHAGKLYIYNNKADLLKASSPENDLSLWSKEKLLKEVPLLKSNPDVVGGIHHIEEDAADSHKFCVELISFMQSNHDLTFLSDTEVYSIEIEDKKVSSIVTSKGKITGDKYIIAMGPQSSVLAKSIGIKLPIYPMKGYSVTVPAKENCPNVSITDTNTKTVYCKLGNNLRIAGFAEFSGYNTNVKQHRIDELLRNANKILPNAGDYTNVLDQWCGLRPATPDSIPIVDQSAYKNLYLNVGHGMLGWTHSAATADILVNIMTREDEKIDSSVFSLERFG